MKGKNFAGDGFLVATSRGIIFYIVPGDNLLESTGDNSFKLHWGYFYTPLGMVRLFSVDGRYTLLGENITDSFTVASLS